MLEERIAEHALKLGSTPLSEQSLHLLKRNLIDAYAGICASLADTAMLKTFKRYVRVVSCHGPLDGTCAGSHAAFPRHNTGQQDCGQQSHDDTLSGTTLRAPASSGPASSGPTSSDLKVSVPKHSDQGTRGASGTAASHASPRDSGNAAAWGTGRSTQLVHAVFMNGILGRRSDLVNTYLSPNHLSGNHPSDNVSLLLTLGGWAQLDGRGLLQAMHLAFILSCAFSDYYCPEGGNFDHDATAGFYTALIAGQVLGLGRAELIEAQRMVGAMGFGTNQAALGTVTDWKHCTYASCAMRGVTAALMARAGFHGPVDIYQGQAGADRFFPHVREFLSPPPDLTSITFKRWQALVFCQTPIDVALDLSPKLPGASATGGNELRQSAIRTVEVWTYEMALKQAGFEAAFQPGTQAGRTHSLPYCIAAALLLGSIDHESFSDQAAQNPELIDLMGKITLHEDAQMSADYPTKAACRIRITTADGQLVEARRDYPRGAPLDPLSDDEISAKALTHLRTLVPRQEAEGIVRRLWNIENESGVGWLLAPLAQEA